MVLYLWRYVVPDPLNYTESPPFFRCEKIIDDACSVIWCERYQEPGEIALVLRATPELLWFFWQSEIMITRDDTDRAMFVEDVVLTTSAETGDYIRITGVSAEGLTKRRVIGQRGAVTDMEATAAIRYYMQENIGSYWYFHTNDEHQHGRNNPYCRMYVNLLAKGDDDERITEKISAEPFGENLCNFITEICKGNEFGYAITFDGEKLLYRSYRGDDRTLNQSDRNAVVFAEEFLNLGNSEYEYSRNEYYSHVIAGGSGTGSTREYGESFTQFRSARGCGLNLRQKFINASGTSGNMLRIAAQNEVLSARETVNFTAEAMETGQFKYRENYFLGDRVSIVNKYGISGTATVTEVVETEDENGTYCIPTLTAFDTSEYFTPVRPEKPELYQGITIYPEGSDPLYYDNFQDAYDYLSANSNLLCDITIGKMLTTIPENAFPNWANINSIVMYSGVVNIDDRAFYSISSLKSVKIPATVMKIGVSAFYRCRKMKTLTIPASVETFGDSAFNSCADLEAVVIQNGVTSIPARCFQYCSSLSEISIPASVEAIGDYAFYHCQSLLTITIPKPQGSISGAPWGAPNATVIWTG